MASEGRGVAASALEGAQDLYQVEETLKKLFEFSTVWAAQTNPFWVVLKLSAILRKYPTFEGVFFMFSWAKQVQN